MIFRTIYNPVFAFYEFCLIARLVLIPPCQMASYINVDNSYSRVSPNAASV